MNIPKDFGMDFGGQFTVEDVTGWAAETNINYVDVRIDDQLRSLPFNTEQTETIRARCIDHDISLGLHTLSAVNTAAYTPIISEAIDQYITRYIDFAEAVGADRVIVHAGYHYSIDIDRRTEASLQRLHSAIEHAEQAGVTLLLENMNPEPENAEMQHLCANLRSCQHYFKELRSPHLQWAFNPPHAHLSDDGIQDFLKELGTDRCGEVRLNDNRGTHEEHLFPGDGTIDFESLFMSLEQNGYDGPYIIALGSTDDMLEAINYLSDMRLNT